MCVQQISDPLTVEEALSGTDVDYWKAAMDEWLIRKQDLGNYCTSI